MKLDLLEVRSTAFRAALLLTLVGCGGGGCGEGCGVAPIPGGFPIEERLADSVQVRVTDEGLDAIEANADTLINQLLPGGLTFDVPRVQGSQSGVDYDICRDNDCSIQAQVQSMELQPEAPNQIRIRIRAAIQSYRPAGTRGALTVRVNPPILPVGNCTADLDSARGGRDYVGLEAVLALDEETEAARQGYTRINVASVGLAPGEGIEDDDISIGGCAGYRWLLNLVKGRIISSFTSNLGETLQGAIDQQLCTRQGETGCPTGTTADGPGPDAICNYPSGECVPMLLGRDGQGDLGAAFLSSISPGTHAPGQFLVAAGGQGEAVNNGLSLFMYGGFIGTNLDFSSYPANNPCVPVRPPPAEVDIPRVATFRGNSVPGLTPDPHVGIGISEDFLNRAGYGMYDSGLLCIGVGTNLSAMLSSAIFGALAPSLNQLVYPASNAPISIALRPQNPPTFEIGGNGEPVLNVSLEGLEMDFYVFSAERYIRFMTFKSDLNIAINLSVRDGQIVPSVENLTTNNPEILNAPLLSEDPASLANLLSSLLGGVVGGFLGELDPISLPAIMGIQLEVSEGGIRGVEENGAEFLGIFANLNFASTFIAQPEIRRAETSAEPVGFVWDPSGVHGAEFAEGPIPTLTVEVDGLELRADHEVSYRVDGQPWSDWEPSGVITIQDRMFRLQARHEIEVRARETGVRHSEDLSPVRLEVIVDTIAPAVELQNTEAGRVTLARDIVTEADALEARVFDGEWSEWMPLANLEALGDEVSEVEVRDEAGNVGSSTSQIIRGRPNPNAAAGCDCSVQGDRGAGQLVWMMLLFGFIWSRRRPQKASDKSLKKAPRRTNAVKTISLLSLPLLMFACDCGGGGGGDDAGMDGGVDGGMDAGDNALPPGQLAHYLDLVESGGSLYVSGYSPGQRGQNYGDLVIGRWNDASESVEWQIVDGVPAAEPTHDPEGWRAGVSEPGDDVGYFTSVVADAGQLYVAYEDRTNASLKFAAGAFGSDFSTHVIDSSGVVDAYTSLVKTSSGFAVAYRAISSVSGAGNPTVTVRVATASGVPTSPADWTITDVVTENYPCVASSCDSGFVCLAAGACTEETSGCGECESGQVCAGGSCQQGVVTVPESYPLSSGLFINLAETRDGHALVFYDRVNGNLMGVSESGGWGTPFVIDGYARTSTGPTDPVGDSGLSADLLVDESGVWHVAYVDGSEERLRYATVSGGTVTGLETIDDGSTDGNQRHQDGRHFVGDDASLALVGGELRVAYQDATAQRAVLARKSGDAWLIEVLNGMDAAGFFTSQVASSTDSYVAYWWRRLGGENGVTIETVR